MKGHPALHTQRNARLSIPDPSRANPVKLGPAGPGLIISVSSGALLLFSVYICVLYCFFVHGVLILFQDQENCPVVDFEWGI